jgi:hypothetical protein
MAYKSVFMIFAAIGDDLYSRLVDLAREREFGPGADG